MEFKTCNVWRVFIFIFILNIYIKDFPKSTEVPAMGIILTIHKWIKLDSLLKYRELGY